MVESNCKEAVLNSSEVLSWLSHGDTEENNEEPQQRCGVPQPKFEPISSRMQVGNVTAWSNVGERSLTMDERSVMGVSTRDVERCDFVTTFSRRLKLTKSWVINNVGCIKLPTFQAQFLSPLSGYMYGTEVIPETSHHYQMMGVDCPWNVGIIIIWLWGQMWSTKRP
jgi:hypothetical protein